jgi:hypothetical protein
MSAPRRPGTRKRSGLAAAPLLAAALCLLLASPPPSRAAERSAEAISVDEIVPGQRGYGLTVFTGTEVERFDVEVLGVIRNLDPGTSYILARLTGHNLEQTGVPAGMSGSPVYIDGRLAGAVAFGWSYSQEAIAGITPIAAMRGMPKLAAPDRGPRAASFDLRQLLAPPRELVEEQLQALAPRLPRGAASGVQWSVTGLGDLATGMLRRYLGEVVPAGRVELPGGRLEGGSPVAALLVSGDLQIAATGTVTERRGDEILAFGHPFLGTGPIRVPMAAASVVTVVSSRADSFKIANVGPVIGAFDHDGHTGVRGRLGLTAPTIPMVLRVHAGEQAREFHMQVATISQLLPSVIASTTLGGLEASSFFGGTQGLDMVARFTVSRYGRVELRQSFDGATAVQDAAALLVAIVSYIENNSLEQVDLEGLEIDMTQVREPRTAVLLAARTESSVVRPGEQVALQLQLASYRGGILQRSVPIRIPEGLPPGRYTLMVGDGTSIDTMVLTSIEPVQPMNFAQAIKVMQSFHSRRDLVVLGIMDAKGLSVDGEVLPRLPSSVLSLWSGGGQAPGTVSLRQVVVQRHVEPMDMPISGQTKVELEVRVADPVAALLGRLQDRRPPAAAASATAPATGHDH